MLRVLETSEPDVVEVAVAKGEGPIGRVRGVFLHQAIPFGADGILNLVTDVTEQRRLEEELRNYAKVAAHDLCEPVMTAGYYAALLDRRLSEADTPKNKELLDGVRRAHTRARSLFDGILEYARSGTSLASEPVQTAALVADVAASLANAVQQLDGHVEIAELPVVRGDHAQLGRVFQDLMANGLKFHSDQPPRLTVSAERRDTTWLFSVRDNGVGIPPELGGDIFTMFKRARRGRRGVRHRPRSLPQDRRGARRGDLGRASRRPRNRHALHPSRLARQRKTHRAATRGRLMDPAIDAYLAVIRSQSARRTTLNGRFGGCIAWRRSTCPSVIQMSSPTNTSEVG